MTAEEIASQLQRIAATDDLRQAQRSLPSLGRLLGLGSKRSSQSCGSSKNTRLSNMVCPVLLYISSSISTEKGTRRNW